MERKNSESLGVRLSDDVQEVVDELTDLRRLVHRYPELAHQEERTQRVVIDNLTAVGIGVRPFAGTGVVGMIRGREPGKVLLLRADMDALPITEENDVSYKNENPGVMHACGHDAHVAMLVVAARLIAKRGLKKGAVKLMFQPAEEGEGGAVKMLEAGILEDPKVDAAIAFHVWAPNPVGEVIVHSGPVAASIDGFKITVQGKGTHAAMPESGIDPIVIASHIVSAAQTLITRRTSPTDLALLSFTSIHGGSAFNIIPERVEMLGTFRTFKEAVRERLCAELPELASTIARSFGGHASYESLGYSVSTINDPHMASLVRQAAAGLLGQDRVLEGAPLMVSEDFGEVLDKVPGALVLLGCGNKELGADFPHHHPRFSIDERVLPIGVELFLECVKRFEF
ncbi:MAG: amidohydrolase [Proteobacteria bacterium]|nr:amidohydrolase [Pseudomonadota bacterium]